ncbi:hypothetical protein CYLTODRAFT_423476 [Cylindrobasidium torrendii FP15055 ss-10]|uniref:Uncharacterized protein n=1 Tax=Cylindrobasidium torrendii FP15055 ss-10 TaxID=1314674 RepID=A0A0D7B819_9AGAR|nr:hypothetical protein CYLTODRAFT_423476 [Cylindrobasidium torrendii FP15055 ss-10]
MVAYINSLPVELLQHIFILTQFRDLTFLAHAQVIENARMAAIVSHVCRRWRVAALGMLDLWIFVSDRRRDSLKSYIKRSSPLPLTLALTHSTLRSLRSKVTERVHHIVILLLQVAYTGKALPAVLNSNSLPNLRTFSISGRYTLLPVSRDPSTQAIAPHRNRFLALKNFRYTSINLLAIPTFPCLETVSADDVFLPMASILKPSASTLTHLTLGKMIIPPRQSTEKVELPVLRTLTLNSTCTVRIASWLRAPALVVLRLQKYTQKYLLGIAHTAADCKQDPLVTLSELIVQIYDGQNFKYWEESIADMFIAFPNVRRVRWDIPCRETVSRYGSRLDESVWMRLDDIAMRVNGEDVNAELLAAMRRPNAKDLVKPY